MQIVPTGWTAEERDSTRKIVASSQVSWKKVFKSTIRMFTIGVSTIGGTDIIASSGGINSDWNKYTYNDESSYLTKLSYERGLKLPIGGLNVAMMDVEFENTSGRFTPRYMGGGSELFTSVYRTHRPVITNAGFNYNGIDNTIPQFVGITNKPAKIDSRNKNASISATDFIGFMQNSYLDREIMFTSQRTDQVIENILQGLGFATSQYNLDQGLNTIPFGLFDKGTKFVDIIDKLTEAENAQFYQGEDGILRFENRQHWFNSPYTTIQKNLYTAQVINAESPDFDHIINVVEIKSPVYVKQPEQIIYRAANLGATQLVPANSTLDMFVEFSDAALSMTTPTSGNTISFYRANSATDGSGSDLSSSISITKVSRFAKAAKLTLSNSSGTNAYITEMVITGRIAKHVNDIYYRAKDDSSITAYDEHPKLIDNAYIQNETWAQSLANMLLQSYAEPDNIQRITIRAIPELQLGDLISWQGHYWRIFNIKSTISPSAGFLQDLTLIQGNTQSYFKIGISTIGGGDLIAA